MRIDTITYLLIPALLAIPWIMIYLLKQGIRKKMLKTSLMGGLAGFIAEYWYFKDYWHPPTLFGPASLCPEDFFFGFTVTGLSVAVYESVYSVRFCKTGRKRKKFFGRLFLAGVAAMMFFSIVLHINSIVVSSCCFIIFTGIMLAFRPDLSRQALLSGILMLYIIVPIYIVLFDVINPMYWDNYWLLARTDLGITVLGHVPLTELCWYFSWGCMAGISHSFASGLVRVRHDAADAMLLRHYVNIEDGV